MRRSHGLSNSDLLKRSCRHTAQPSHCKQLGGSKCWVKCWSYFPFDLDMLCRRAVWDVARPPAVTRASPFGGPAPLCGAPFPLAHWPRLFLGSQLHVWPTTRGDLPTMQGTFPRGVLLVYCRASAALYGCSSCSSRPIRGPRGGRGRKGMSRLTLGELRRLDAKLVSPRLWALVCSCGSACPVWCRLASQVLG